MVKRLLLFVVLLSGCWSFASAQSDKDFINETGTELLNQWDADGYRNVAALLKRAMSFDQHAITVWGVNSLNAIKHTITQPWHGISDGYMLYLRPSSFTGHFKVEGNSWVKESDADDVQFTFPDENGTSCVFKLVTKGSTRSITLEADEDEDDDDFEDADEGNVVIDDLSKDVKFVTVEIPERVEMTMTQGSKQLMQTTVEFDLSCFVDDWNIIDNGFMVSINSSFAKSTGSGTFDIGLNNVGYKPGIGVSFSFSAKKDGKTLVAWNLTAPGTIGGSLDMTRAGGIGLQSLNFDVDIMGRIQAKYNIADMDTYSDLMDQLEDSESEAEAKSIIASLSKQITGNMYYNNGSQSKGSFGLEAYYDEEEWEWTSRPTITFASDNSTYALEEYFSEENFPDVVSGIRDIITELQELAASVTEDLNKMNDDAMDISEPAVAAGKMTFDGQQLSLSGLQAGARIEVFTVGGRLCSRTVAGSDGRATVFLSSQPNGVYVVKTPAGNGKFIKK